MKRSPILAILVCTAIMLVGCQNNSSTNAGETEVNTTVAFSESKTETKAEETEATTVYEETEETTQDVTEKSKVEPTTKKVQLEKPTEKVTQSEPTEKATQKPAPKPTKKPTPKPTQKPTEKPKPKPTQKPTQAPAKPKPKPTQPKPSIDKNAVISKGISYGKAKGMTYDSSLNTGNASWFPPSDLNDFPTTKELTQVCYEKIDYLLSSWGEKGYKAKDFAFNVIISGSDLYLVYG